MDNSESQFQELIAQLSAHAGKVFESSVFFPPLGLALTSNDSVETSVGVANDQAEMADSLNAIQGHLKEKANAGELKATCIAFANYETGHIDALLENNENYCALVKIPVLEGPRPQLDLANISVEDGSIYVFPIANDS